MLSQYIPVHMQRTIAKNYYQLPTAYCQSPTANCPIPIAYWYKEKRHKSDTQMHNINPNTCYLGFLPSSAVTTWDSESMQSFSSMRVTISLKYLPVLCNPPHAATCHQKHLGDVWNAEITKKKQRMGFETQIFEKIKKNHKKKARRILLSRERFGGIWKRHGSVTDASRERHGTKLGEVPNLSWLAFFISCLFKAISLISMFLFPILQFFTSSKSLQLSRL